MEVSDIQDETTRSAVSDAIAKTITRETRNFAWSSASRELQQLGELMIQPVDVRAFVYNEVAGIGAFVLTYTVDVFRVPLKSDVRCTVFSVTKTGDVRRIYSKDTSFFYHGENWCGVLSLTCVQPVPKYKVADLRIEEKSIVANDADGHIIKMSFSDISSDRSMETSKS